MDGIQKDALFIAIFVAMIALAFYMIFFVEAENPLEYESRFVESFGEEWMITNQTKDIFCSGEWSNIDVSYSEVDVRSFAFSKIDSFLQGKL